MWERLFVSVVFLLLTEACYAQWTAKIGLCAGMYEAFERY